MDRIHCLTIIETKGTVDWKQSIFVIFGVALRPCQPLDISRLKTERGYC